MTDVKVEAVSASVNCDWYWQWLGWVIIYFLHQLSGWLVMDLGSQQVSLWVGVLVLQIMIANPIRKQVIMNQNYALISLFYIKILLNRPMVYSSLKGGGGVGVLFSSAIKAAHLHTWGFKNLSERKFPSYYTYKFWILRHLPALYAFFWFASFHSISDCILP